MRGKGPSSTRACRSESEDPDISGQMDAKLKSESTVFYSIASGAKPIR